MVSKPDTERCASEEAEPRRGVDMRRCASKDTGPQGGGLWHIDWRRERVLARTLGLEGVWIVRSHIGWEENETPFIRMWKPLPSRRVLKTLRRSPKGKTQRRQHLLAVGLSRYALGPRKIMDKLLLLDVFILLSVPVIRIMFVYSRVLTMK